MRKLLLVTGMLALTASLVFAGGPQEETTQSIRLSMGGSTTVEPIITNAIEVYVDAIDSGAVLSYDAPGSSAGVRGVLDGTYDLGAASRALKDSEIEAGAVATQIAVDGLAVIVNGSVPIDDLTLEQVAAIFVGDINNWSELGGPDADIVVVNRDEASGTRGAFVEIALDKYYEDPIFDEDLVTESNGNMGTMVAQTPYAIGYASLSVLPALRAAGGKSLSIAGVTDDIPNIISGDYPIARPLNVVTNGPATGDALTFIDFLLSEDGQDIVESVGYIRME
jgi:phosphate transport system substrate-binding protein